MISSTMFHVHTSIYVLIVLFIYGFLYYSLWFLYNCNMYKNSYIPFSTSSLDNVYINI